MKLLTYKNTKKQGDAGLGLAIAWASVQGHTVCVPLTDSQSYDLIFDFGAGPKTIQVKTTLGKSKSGKPQVQLRTMGGNRSGTGKTKMFDPAEVDFLFVVTGEGVLYLIPSVNVRGKTCIVLCADYDAFKLS